jgi:exosortase A
MMQSHALNDPNVTNSRRTASWVALLAAWISILFAFRGDILLVIESWETMPSHAHGYVVVLVVAYFLWKKRPFIDAVPFSPSLIGFGAFLLAALAALVGELVSAAVVVQFSSIFLIIAAVWAIMGYQAFKTLFGPLAFLFFTISFGQDVLPTLMDWTADATVAALRASGIPVFQQDRHFIIPSGSWAVVEACSGIRYLFTAFFIGTIYAYITYRSWLKRVFFVAAMLALALFANWLRAYTIVLVAHLSNNEWGLGLSHLTFGWVIFGVVVFTAFWIGSYWQEPDPVPPSAKSATAGQLAPTAVTAALIVVLTLGIPLLSNSLLNGSGDQAATPELDFSKSLAGLTSTKAEHAVIAPEYLGAARIHQQIFRQGAADLLLYIAYYRNQTQGRELVNVTNKLEPTKDWNWTGNRQYAIAGSPVAKLHVEKYTLGSDIALATRIYWNSGYSTQSAMQSKLAQAINLLTGRGDDGAAIILAVSAKQETEAQRALESFIQQRLPGILEDLDKTRQTR